MTNQRETRCPHALSGYWGQFVRGLPPNTDVWIRELQLRAYLQVSASTIRRLRARGLPSLGSDRLRRYHLETVLQWLSKHL